MLYKFKGKHELKVAIKTVPDHNTTERNAGVTSCASKGFTDLAIYEAPILLVMVGSY